LLLRTSIPREKSAGNSRLFTMVELVISILSNEMINSLADTGSAPENVAAVTNTRSAPSSK
tara:strand:+ start:36337 stop:36519 length:183 start_codon:yes stop_codon:yes gene_type:complete